MSESRDKPFTVAELIEELRKLPAEMRVMVRGYEGGYHDCQTPAIEPIKLNVNSEWYYGPHDTPSDHESSDVKAAIL